MKILYDSDDFTLSAGAYLTPAFKVNSEWLTIQVKTTGISIVSVETSIDGVDWFPVEYSDFTTDASGGLQSYNECQLDLHYRIKSTLEPISIKILL